MVFLLFILSSLNNRQTVTLTQFTPTGGYTTNIALVQTGDSLGQQIVKNLALAVSSGPKGAAF